MKYRATIFTTCILLSAVLLVILFFHPTTPSNEQSTPSSSTLDEYRVVFKNCWFEVPWQENIRCGELHTAASTGSFVLPVVIIEDPGYDKKPDAVFYFQGGPGAGAGLNDEGIAYWLRWRDNMALGRDLILMDPRGTGRSRPALQCREYDELSLAV